MVNDLNAIMSESIRTNKSELDDVKARKLTWIPVFQLVRSKESEEIYSINDALKNPIIENGLEVPLTVRKMKDGSYEILSGNRRHAAFEAILKDDPTFKYRYMSDQLLDPYVDGLPCTVVNREMSDAERKMLIISANNNRDYDNLEIYNMTFALSEIYEHLKNEGKIKWGDGRKRDWMKENLPISTTTISSILDNKWMINSKNIDAVKKAGSYAKYVEELNESLTKMKVESSSVENNEDDQSEKMLEKEQKYIKSITNHFLKADFQNSGISEDDLDEIATDAIITIQTIMASFNLSKGDL